MGTSSYTMTRFSLSLTSFAELQNDERTRAFLTVEIGAGHHEVCFLTNYMADFGTHILICPS